MEKVCYVMLKTLGDVICSFTIVAEIKRKHPDSRLTFFVAPEYQELVRLNPLVDDVYCPTVWDEVLVRLVNGFDTVYCPYQTTPEDNVWHHTAKYRHQHLVDFYAQRCGLKLSDRRLIIYPTGKSPVMPTGDDTVAVATANPALSKNWRGMQELVFRIKGAGFPVVQLGTKQDWSLGGVQDLRGNMSLGEVARYLTKCGAFIGVDTGLSYMAAATGIPTFCILGPVVPTTSGPFGPNVVHLLSPTRSECQTIRCHTNCLYATQEPDGSCINRLTVDEAEAQIVEYLTAELNKEEVPQNAKA